MFSDPALWLQGLLWLDYFHKVFFQLFQLMPPWTLLLRVYTTSSIDRHTHRYSDTLWVHYRHISHLWTLLNILLHHSLFEFRNRWAYHSWTDNSWLFHLNLWLSSNLPSCHFCTAPRHCDRCSTLSYQSHAINLHAILRYTWNNLWLSRLLVVDLVH